MEPGALNRRTVLTAGVASLLGLSVVPGARSVTRSVRPVAHGEPVTLYAGRDTDVGEVVLEPDGADLQVTYDTSGSGWEILDTHLHVAGDPDGLPVNAAGNPKVGHFEHTGEPDGPATTVNYGGIDPGGLDDHAVVAAKAEVTDGGAIEGAWADGATINPEPGNWATYFVVELAPEFYLDGLAVEPNHVVAGEPATVSVAVANVGTANGGTTLELAINGIEAATALELDPGEREVVAFEVTVDEPGEYTVTVSETATGAAVSVGLEVVSAAEAELGAVDIDGQGPDATVGEDDAFGVGVPVTNVGGQAGAFDVSLAVDGPAGVSERTTTGTLDPGGTESVGFDDVGPLDAGEYGVTVSTADDESVGTLTVEEAPSGSPRSSIASLDIAGQGASATLSLGEDASVTVRVANHGPGTGRFDVDLEVAPSSGGENTTLTQRSNLISPGTDRAVTFELEPPDATGAYDVTASTEHDAATGTLTVEGPDPVSALSNLDIAGSGDYAFILAGTDATVAVDVENVDTIGGTIEVDLEISHSQLGGASATTHTDELQPGDVQRVSFSNVTGRLSGIEGTDEYYQVTVATHSGRTTGTLVVLDGAIPT